jgi:hypothetical protein
VIPVRANQRAPELVRVTRVSVNNYRSEGIADVRFVPFDREEGWATAKEGEARARARRVLRLFRKRKMMVRNLVDASRIVPID